jgi:hypothetical protein
MSWIDNYLVASSYAEGNRLSAVSITVPSGLNNTMLIAMVTGRSTWTNPEHITGFSWQSNAFSSFVAHDDYDGDGEGEYYIWYLLNPPAAGPANVSISYGLTRNHDTLAEIHLLKNVVQQAPQNHVAANGGGTTRTNSGISCEIGDLILCQLGSYGDLGTPSFGENQTILTHEFFSGVTMNSSYLTSWKKALTTSESMTQSWTISRDHRQGSFVVSTDSVGANKMILVMSSIYDRIQENRKKLRIGSFEGFKQGRNGLWKPQSGLVTI